MYFSKDKQKKTIGKTYSLFCRSLTKIPKYQASIDVMVFFFKKNKPKGKNSVVFSSIKRVYTSLNAIVFIF
jgi:hypothetical protein